MTVLDRLTVIFRDEFEDSALVINDSTTANQIENWDSLATINIIVASEWEFKIKFENLEIQSIRSVGDFLRIIENRAGR